VHVTHRCHGREFLLRFEVDRRRYRERLRQMALAYPVSVLNYVITSNHVHLLLWAAKMEYISEGLRFLQGTAAQDYNRRKHREGAFWSGRYHATLIQKGAHLSRCLYYIDLNMVRAGRVKHPAQWVCGGFHELAGRRQRYRILDVPCLLRCLEMKTEVEFRDWHLRTIEDVLASGPPVREPDWSRAVAVGDEAWVRRLAGRVTTGRCQVTALAAPTPFDARAAGSYALSAPKPVSDGLVATWLSKP